MFMRNLIYLRHSKAMTLRSHNKNRMRKGIHIMHLHWSYGGNIHWRTSFHSINDVEDHSCRITFMQLKSLPGYNHIYVTQEHNPGETASICTSVTGIYCSTVMSYLEKLWHNRSDYTSSSSINFDKLDVR